MDLVRLMPPLDAAKIGASWGLGHCLGIVLVGGIRMDTGNPEIREQSRANMNMFDMFIFVDLCLCQHEHVLPRGMLAISFWH